MFLGCIPKARQSFTGTPRHILSKGAGDKWQASTGHGSGGQGRSLLKVLSTPLDCKKTSFLNIKMQLILDKIIQQTVGGPAHPWLRCSYFMPKDAKTMAKGSKVYWCLLGQAVIIPACLVTKRPW